AWSAELPHPAGLRCGSTHHTTQPGAAQTLREKSGTVVVFVSHSVTPQGKWPFTLRMTEVTSQCSALEEDDLRMEQPNQPSWELSADCHADDGLLVTQGNQTCDLLRAQGLRGRTGNRRKSTAEWLEDHGLTGSGLSFTHLLSHGTSTVIHGVPRMHLEISATALNEFEARLLKAIDLYHARIKWLTEGSLKVFGLVKGSRLGMLIDSSDSACEDGRLEQLQRDVQSLISEQLCCLKQLYAVSFGSEVSVLWDGPRVSNPDRVRALCAWVQQLAPAGGCNFLEALRRVLLCRELDSLLLILHSCPDQTSDMLFDYVEQCTLGRELSLLTVAYWSSDHMTIKVAKRLAEVTKGRFHIFSNTGKGVVDSTDLQLMWGELKAAREVLRNVQEMRGGRVQDTLVTVVPEVWAEMDSLCLSRPSPSAANEDAPLRLQPPGLLPSPSTEWLQSHGLRAQRLGVYQVLAPNAHSPLQEFVPILRKTVSSTVNQKAMVQFEWHDGTVKNVHVDLPLLHTYQKQLARAVQVLEKRVAWLNSGSRQIWGTGCGSGGCVSVELPVPASHTAKWVQRLRCGGSRNMLAALRLAVEGHLQGEPEHSQGLYLLTCGVPDHDMGAVLGYVLERSGGDVLRLHVCLFGGAEPPLSCPPPPRYASHTDTAQALRTLAHSSGGRFHCFTETGVLESDDITALMAEVQKAADYMKKCSVLVEAVSCREPKRGANEGPALEGRQLAVTMETWIPPRPTALTRARLVRTQPPPPPPPHQLKEQREEERSPLRALTWSPSSAKIPRPPVNSWGPTGSGGRQRKFTVSHHVFYTEDGNNLGKGDTEIWFLNWLKRFSVRKLKLDLDRLASGPDCTHHKREVPVTRNPAHSPTLAYCSVLPSVYINGTLKHLQVAPWELDQYLTQTGRLLRRYARRMRWLLSGSRRVFGTVLEQQVFTLLAFSGEVRAWCPSLVEASEEACREAEQWVWQLCAHGGTCTMQALQETKRISTGKCITVHTICYSCADSTANEFLQKLAQQTGGRFHHCHGDMDTLVARTLKEEINEEADPLLPTSEGDDLRGLAEEMTRLRRFQMQAAAFRKILLENRSPLKS
ncbi:hypothetical protein JZ751_027265, partial [Albula glossodonta]